MANKTQLATAAGFRREMVLVGNDVHYKGARDQMRHLPTFPVRKDDVFLCTYPRSGTHMIWEIVSMITAGKAEYSAKWTEQNQLDFQPLDYLASVQSPRVMFTHHKPQFLPKGVFENRCHVIQLQRNPKDVIVSRYNQYTRETKGNESPFGGSWDQLLDLHFTGCAPFGDIFDYMIAWNNFPQDYPEVPFCQLQFEDVKKDQGKAVRYLADFLGRPLKEDVCQEIAEACSFGNLRRAYETEKDKTHCFWSAYFRKGVSGDWKNWFTVAQSERFDQLYLEKLKKPFPY